MRLLAKTFAGLEEVLAEELRTLGAKNVSPVIRAVSFDGDKAFLYRANLCLRTALRILVPIERFTARNEKELYQNALKIDWSKYLSNQHTFAIDATTFSDQFSHSRYAALKVKDAIADQFRRKTNERPSIDTEDPDVRINLHIYKNKVNLSLDSSGESLHKRNYRNQQHPAPLNEVLAAGMVLLSDWDKTTPFYDLMCGSGTLALEAAMIARNIPPNLLRKHYGFMGWKDFDADLWTTVLTKEKEGVINSAPPFFASDASPRFVRIAEQSARELELYQNIKFTCKAFEDYLPETEEGTVLLNPPYGERMEGKELNTLYEKIGNHLKQCYSGFDAWILSANKEALKHIGLRASRKATLFNGALECKFQKYSMYRGSKKRKFQQQTG